MDADGESDWAAGGAGGADMTTVSPAAAGPWAIGAPIGPFAGAPSGAWQFGHVPGVPGVFVPHVGHCMAQTSPCCRFPRETVGPRTNY
ncbi:hypothetical protein Acsp04_48540 [Actinomadura sp. NBRC 104425]|nr:hypothetical protein Acsp04_48540 [Actinomadura sp. NBRC 104425]